MPTVTSGDMHDDRQADWRDKVAPFPLELTERYRTRGLWTQRTVGEEFEAVAAARASQAAVVDPYRTLSYGELDERSNAIGAGLLELGLRPGDRVIFQTTNRVETVEAWYGCLKAGLVPVCALPIHGHHEIDAIVESTQARGHLVDADVRGGAVLDLALEVKAQAASMQYVLSIGGDAGACDASMSDLADATGSWDSLRAARRQFGPDDLAILQLSGGTTATPKAIPRLHAESWYNASATAQCYPIAAGERVAHVLPLVHNAGLHSALHAGHSVGATVLVCGPDPNQFIPFLLEQRVDSLLLVPGMVAWLMERKDFRELVGGLRRLSLSAAVVPPELFDELEALGVPVVQQFGMGEGFCTGMPLDAPREMRRQTVGYPLSAEDEFRVVGIDGADVPTEHDGELWVRGPYTIRGYWDDPERNAAAFTPDGFYKTGDVISTRVVDGRCCLVVGGRMKDLINRGGEKINAEEVEEALGRHPRVREAALVAMPDRRLGERGCAYVVARSPGPGPTLAELSEMLAEIGVAKYKWPERVEYVDALPRTPVGKVEKARLRQLIAAQLQEESEGCE